jgi:hypothetical protein
MRLGAAINAARSGPDIACSVRGLAGWPMPGGSRFAGYGRVSTDL